MADRGFEKVARDLSDDFAALRNDLRKLTSVVTDLASDHADDGRSSFFGALDKARGRASDAADTARGRFNDAADNARGRFDSATDQARGRFSDAADLARSRFSDTADLLADRASSASSRARAAGAEIEHRIEKNPLTAVMIAIVGGLVIGALSRSRK